MSAKFVLKPISALRPHEEIDLADVEWLAGELAQSGVFRDPIWVAEESDVILNGHHRFAALQRLGASRVPAWVFPYLDASVTVDRWSPGPPITKQEVIDRARAGQLFPPKTTRHRLSFELPLRPTPTSELFDGGTSRGPSAQRADRRRSREGARSFD